MLATLRLTEGDIDFTNSAQSAQHWRPFSSALLDFTSYRQDNAKP
jgi:hypothetical protein